MIPIRWWWSSLCHVILINSLSFYTHGEPTMQMLTGTVFIDNKCVYIHDPSAPLPLLNSRPWALSAAVNLHLPAASTRWQRVCVCVCEPWSGLCVDSNTGWQLTEPNTLIAAGKAHSSAPRSFIYGWRGRSRGEVQPLTKTHPSLPSALFLFAWQLTS